MSVACNAMTGADALEVRSTGTETVTSSAHPDPDAAARASAPQNDASAAGDALSTNVDGSSGPAPSFTDAFGRPDALALGNGWVEKTDAFSLSNEGVLQVNAGLFFDRIAYRRQEVHLDVETSIDVTFGTDVDSDPGLYLRMQPASEREGLLVGYSFFSYRDLAKLVRYDGDATEVLASSTISPPLDLGTPHQLVFRITATNPVRLDAVIRRPNKQQASAVTLQTSDASARRITNGGKVGFGSSKADGTRFDNFVRVDL